MTAYTDSRWSHPSRFRSEGFAGCLGLLGIAGCTLDGYADRRWSRADISRHLDLCLNRLFG